MEETTTTLDEANQDWIVKYSDLSIGISNESESFSANKERGNTCFKLRLQNVLKRKRKFLERQKFNLYLTLLVTRTAATFSYAYVDISIQFQTTSGTYSVIDEKILFMYPNNMSCTWLSIKAPDSKSDLLKISSKIKLLRENAGGSSCYLYKNIKRNVDIKSDKNTCSQQSSIELINNFNDLYTKSLLHDVIIKIESQDFAAHSAILSARSPVFREMFSHDTKEKTSGVIDLGSSANVASWKIVQHFIYTGKLDFTKCNKQATQEINEIGDSMDSESTEEESTDHSKGKKSINVTKEITPKLIATIDWKLLKNTAVMAEKYGLITAVREMELIMIDQIKDDNFFECLRCAHELDLKSLEEQCFIFFGKYTTENKKMTMESAAWISLTDEYPALLRKYCQYCMK